AAQQPPKPEEPTDLMACCQGAGGYPVRRSIGAERVTKSSGSHTKFLILPMDRADGRKLDRAIQQLDLVPDLLCSPARVLLFELQDHVLGRKRQAIGVPIRPAAPIGQALDPRVFVPVVEFVAG